MHLADAFIQSDLQCIQAIHVLSLCNKTCIACIAHNNEKERQMHEKIKQHFYLYSEKMRGEFTKRELIYIYIYIYIYKLILL